MNDLILQGCTTFWTCLSIWLISQNNKWTVWGFWAGLVAQVFWTITYFKYEQHLFLILDAWYVICYINGIYNYKRKV